jgi:N-acetyl-anhydromuramyl-L-alanine amidase AmpD
MKLVPAKSFTPAARTAVDLVVIHTAEAHERPQTAENVAAWFAGPQAPRASAHYTVDSDSVVQSVLEKDVAWHAGPANGYSIGIEHAGFAAQTPAEWADAYSVAMLERSAQLVAEICKRYGIPVRRVSAEDLKAGGERRRGICGHIDVTNGLTGGRGHWDPGPSFPWQSYLARVAELAGQRAPQEADADPPPAWVEVISNGVRWAVAPRYVAPVGIGEAVTLALREGCELPTPDLVDAVWRAADLRIAPIVRNVANGLLADWGASSMASAATIADQAKRIDAAIGDRPFRLLAGSHKDVVRTSDGRIGLYGWHTLAGAPLQRFFGGHALSWKDYSQGLRLCRRV